MVLFRDGHCANSTRSCVTIQSFYFFTSAQYDGLSLTNDLLLLRLNSGEEIFVAAGELCYYLRRFNSDELLLPHCITGDHERCSWLLLYRDIFDRDKDWSQLISFRDGKNRLSKGLIFQSLTNLCSIYVCRNILIDRFSYFHSRLHIHNYDLIGIFDRFSIFIS